MNKANHWIALCAIAALTPIASLRADDAQVKVETDQPKVETKVKTDRSDTRIETEVRSDHGVRPQNKATALLGMEVKNNNNEKLGEVKDIVLDPRSGRVEYVVLAVGGFLGIGEKLLAVPFNALRPSSTEDRKLVMNASRERIAQAPGFAATNWPDVRDPGWDGATFWNELKSSSIGGSATSETGYERSRERKADHKTKVTTGDKSIEVDAHADTK